MPFAAAALLGLALGAAAVQAQPALKPEDVVTFRAGFAICQTREEHDLLMEHAARDEKTKVLAILESGRCANNQLSLRRRFKVIRVERDLIEFVPVGSNRYSGMWTLAKAVAPPKPPK